MPRAPLPLRAHNVLCLQGFRGAGYSQTFVRRMRAVADLLAATPEHEVKLLTAPDTLCLACPHLVGGCTLGGPDHEAHMRAQDEAVLERLGFAAGEVTTWEEVRRRIASTVRAEDLPGLCTTCPWLSMGWCQEGIHALREGTAPESP